jgi:hypothetical protein
VFLFVLFRHRDPVDGSVADCPLLAHSSQPEHWEEREGDSSGGSGQFQSGGALNWAFSDYNDHKGVVCTLNSARTCRRCRDCVRGVMWKWRIGRDGASAAHRLRSEAGAPRTCRQFARRLRAVGMGRTMLLNAIAHV